MSWPAASAKMSDCTDTSLASKVHPDNQWNCNAKHSLFRTVIVMVDKRGSMQELHHQSGSALEGEGMCVL